MSNSNFDKNVAEVGGGGIAIIKALKVVCVSYENKLSKFILKFEDPLVIQFLCNLIHSHLPQHLETKKPLSF